MVVSDLAAPRCAHISVLQVADSSIMDYYLNLSTCSSTALWQVIFSVHVSFVAAIIFYLFYVDLQTKFNRYAIYLIMGGVWFKAVSYTHLTLPTIYSV